LAKGSPKEGEEGGEGVGRNKGEPIPRDSDKYESGDRLSHRLKGNGKGRERCRRRRRQDRCLNEVPFTFLEETSRKATKGCAPYSRTKNRNDPKPEYGKSNTPAMASPGPANSGEENKKSL